MRSIKHIVIHCTATAQTATVESMKKYWSEHLKWKSPGYHFVVKPDGTVVNVCPIEQVSNGVERAVNQTAINIAYIGGVDAKGKPIDNRTPAQKAAMLKLVMELKYKFKTAVVKGHRDFSPDTNLNGKIDYYEYIKSCPCFDAQPEYAQI